MVKFTQIKTAQKIALVVAVAAGLSAVVLVGVIWANKGLESQKPAATVRAIDSVELKNNYRESFREAIKAYTAGVDLPADLAGDGLARKTQQAETALLDLVVPTEYKDFHLKAVMGLEEIKRGIKNGDEKLINAKIEGLKNILVNF